MLGEGGGSGRGPKCLYQIRRRGLLGRNLGKTGAKIQFSPQNHPENHPKIHLGKSGVGLGCVTVSQLSVIPQEPLVSTPKNSCLNPLRAKEFTYLHD